MDKPGLYDVLCNHFKGLPVFLIHGKEEAGQHDDNHCHSCKARPCAVFEQKEKWQAYAQGCRKTNELPLRKVESDFCFDFG